MLTLSAWINGAHQICIEIDGALRLVDSTCRDRSDATSAESQRSHEQVYETLDSLIWRRHGPTRTAVRFPLLLL